MQPTLTPEQRTDLLQRGFTRRSFGRIASVLAAGAALLFYNEAALAQLSRLQKLPPGAVKINANENPLGPCAEAAEAIHNVVRNGGRYMYERTDELAEAMAARLGVKFSNNPDSNYITIFAGLSAPLHQAVIAFCSHDRPFVKADPGYEAGEIAARYVGAGVVHVPLESGTYGHDVKAMLRAAPQAGLFYVCNPNNPTGMVTSRSDIEFLMRRWRSLGERLRSGMRCGDFSSTREGCDPRPSCYLLG